MAYSVWLTTLDHIFVSLTGMDWRIWDAGRSELTSNRNVKPALMIIAGILKSISYCLIILRIGSSYEDSKDDWLEINVFTVAFFVPGLGFMLGFIAATLSWPTSIPYTVAESKVERGDPTLR